MKQRSRNSVRTAILLAIGMVASCAQQKTPPAEGPQASPEPLKAIQIPADYVPGAVYGLDGQRCAVAGGQETVDASGLSFCSLGAAESVFVCEGGLIVSLIPRTPGRKILHLSTGDFAEVLPAAGEGEVWTSGDYALRISGSVAEFQSADETLDCLPAESF